MTSRALLFSFCVFLSAPSVALRAAEADDIRVTGSTGEVAVIPAGSQDASPAKAGLPLGPGDRVVTGKSGRVELGLKNGTVLRLGESSVFSVEPSSDRWTAFRLHVGRLLAKFAPSTGRPYRVKTPVAVAAIRGTELVLDVSDAGALQGGVVEGEVAFEPLTEEDAPAAAVTTSWSAETVGTSEGISVEPEARPRRMTAIPAPLVASLAEFPSLRERVPALRSEWKPMNLVERQKLRQESLRERIRWAVPTNVRDHLEAPSQRPRPAVPSRKAVPRPAPDAPPRRSRRPAKP